MKIIISDAESEGRTYEVDTLEQFAELVMWDVEVPMCGLIELSMNWNSTEGYTLILKTPSFDVLCEGEGLVILGELNGEGGRSL